MREQMSVSRILRMSLERLAAYLAPAAQPVY
jgi:hypothetical protein